MNGEVLALVPAEGRRKLAARHRFGGRGVSSMT